MILAIDDTILNVKTVVTMLVAYTPEITIVNGFLGFGNQEVKEDSWTLKFTFINGADNETYTFTSQSKNKKSLSDQARKIIAGIKNADSSMIDAAFEEAFLKG